MDNFWKSTCMLSTGISKQIPFNKREYWRGNSPTGYGTVFCLLGGRRSNLHHLESAIDNSSDVVVDIAVDGVEDFSDDVFNMLPNSEDSDDEEEFQCSDDVIENVMNEAKIMAHR